MEAAAPNSDDQHVPNNIASENITNVSERNNGRQQKKRPSVATCDAVLVRSFLTVFSHSINQQFRTIVLETDNSRDSQELETKLRQSLARLKLNDGTVAETLELNTEQAASEQAAETRSREDREASNNDANSGHEVLTIAELTEQDQVVPVAEPDYFSALAHFDTGDYF